jgi:hypothetical protein
MVCSECGRLRPATKFPTTDEAHRDTECRECRDERRRREQSPSGPSADRFLVPSSQYIEVTQRYLDRGLTKAGEIAAAMRADGIPVGYWLNPTLNHLTGSKYTVSPKAPKSSPGIHEGTPAITSSISDDNDELLVRVAENADRINWTLDELEALYRERDELYVDALIRGVSKTEITNALSSIKRKRATSLQLYAGTRA